MYRAHISILFSKFTYRQGISPYTLFIGICHKELHSIVIHNTQYSDLLRRAGILEICHDDMKWCIRNKLC